MTDLADHAKRGGGPEIVLTSDLPQRGPGRIESTVLADHDELTEEGQFPEHGKFLTVTELEREDEEEGGKAFWECTAALAGTVMELAAEEEVEVEGAVLDVHQVSKTPAGEWRFVVDVSEAA